MSLTNPISPPCVRQLAAVVVVCSVSTGAASAQETSAPSVTFDGYATLGAVYANEDEADFVADVFAPDGAGYSRRWSPEVDSRLGLQVTADVTARLAAIGQVIVEQRYDETYEPAIEWANLRYDVTDSVRARVGRMIQPSLMVSEHRQVGYAQPWIRPPQEVYRLIPVTNIDAASIRHRTRFGGFTNRLRATYGQSEEKLIDGRETEARDSLIVTDTLESGSTTLFASYSTFRLRIDAINDFFDQYRQLGSDGHAVAERYDVDGERFHMLGLGARYDDGDWFALGEWTQSESDTFIGDTRG